MIDKININSESGGQALDDGDEHPSMRFSGGGEAKHFTDYSFSIESNGQSEFNRIAEASQLSRRHYLIRKAFHTTGERISDRFSPFLTFAAMASRVIVFITLLKLRICV